ncbi:MAG: hypothetical protein LUE26_04805 [Alistipes sp.]|nr:hypothetical protein [Alistipes sp.]
MAAVSVSPVIISQSGFSVDDGSGQEFLIGGPEMFTNNSGKQWRGIGSVWAIWLLGALALLTRWIGRARGYHDRKTVGLLFFVSAAELLYIFGFDFIFKESGGPLWFTNPLIMGFFTGIVTTFAFYIVAAIQVVAAINYLEEHYGEDSGIVTGAYLLGGGAALIGLWYIPYVPVAGVVLGCVGALVMFVQSFRIVFTLSDDISTGFLRALIYLVVSAAGALLVYHFPSVFGYIFDYIAN